VDSLPAGLGRFISLETLSFRQNILSSINSSLSQLINLVELDLNDNQITEISGLESLVNLKILDLSYNRITQIKGNDTFYLTETSQEIQG